MGGLFAGMSVENFVIPALLILLGALTTLSTNLWLHRRQDRKDAEKAAVAAAAEVEKVRAEARAELQRRMGELESKMMMLKESVQPISMAFQQILIKELTHFHEVRTDELLELIGPPYMLTDDQEKELTAALDKRVIEAGDLLTQAERDAAIMLPMLIRRVKAELAMGIPTAELKVVGVPQEGDPEMHAPDPQPPNAGDEPEAK